MRILPARLAADESHKVLAAGSVLAKLTYLCCRYWILLAYPVTLYIQGRDHAPSTCEKLFRVPMLIAIPSVRPFLRALIVLMRCSSAPWSVSDDLFLSG